jgi:ABC-type sulfate transport system permease component
MPRPSNYLAWAIVTIILFWPIGIAAIIKSTQVDRLWLEGRYSEARESSNTTKTLCLVATILAAVFIVLSMILFFTVFNSFPRYAPPTIR